MLISLFLRLFGLVGVTHLKTQSFLVLFLVQILVCINEYVWCICGLLDYSVAFIGPGDHAMNELGDKINSTILAQSVDVSVVPWSGTGVFVDYSVRF